MKGRPTERNKQEYKLAFKRAQRWERQLQREHERRLCQIIRQNPNTDIAKALRINIQRRSRQKALNREMGKLLKPKEFEDYLNTTMSLEEAKELAARQFTVDDERHTSNVVSAINFMANNIAVGTDGLHVEMLKANAEKTARLLTEMWKTIGSKKIVADAWLRSILVPLFKRKGEQANPKNSRSLTILSHARKVTGKAIVLEL